MRGYAGDVDALGWWDLFINYGYVKYSSFIYAIDCSICCMVSQLHLLSLVLRVAECFAFLICTKWYNPAIHRRSHLTAAASSSSSIRSYTWSNGVLVLPDEENQENTMCSMQDIGGHIMKIPLIGFQVILFMYLEVRQAKKFLVREVSSSFSVKSHYYKF